MPIFLKKLPPAKPEKRIGINTVGKPVDGIDFGEVFLYKLFSLLLIVIDDSGFLVGVGVGLTGFKKLKNPPVFFLTGVGETTVFEFEAGLVLLFKLILPVTTAKKTRTTTKPKTKEITLLKLSI